MKLIKILIAISVLFTFCSPCIAENEKMIKASFMKQTIFNHGVLNMDRDSSIFIHSLNLIKKDNTEELKNYYEYMLDVIVCEAWDNIEKMNPNQKSRTLDFLKNIKNHRAENQKGKIKVDPTQFSKHFESFDSSYSQKADSILANLE